MTMVASPTAIALLTLMNLKGVGRRTALKIVDKPIQETDLVDCREAFLSHVSRVHQPGVSNSELLNAWTRSEELLKQSHELDVQVFSFHDQGYPERLRRISDPPAVLFVKGKPDGLHATKSLAVVGTREPSSYGVGVAKEFARTAAEAGFVIVSGLAHGCDALAHKGCIEVHGTGIAVLAHGLEKVYPAANRDLAKCLLEEGGCLVSEYPVWVTPVRSAFVERDRIQSGLSDAVLVIETDIGGGTMHTVRFAHDQKRPLACIAHPEKFLKEDKARGNQKLIKDRWARPIEHSEGLITFLNGLDSLVSAETSWRSGDALYKQQKLWAS